jgi:hypothetical protein
MEHGAIEFIAYGMNRHWAQSTINTSITAWTSAAAIITGVDLARSEKLCMAKRRLRKERPRTGKYDEIYDIDAIWSLINSWPDTEAMTTEQLRLKVIILLKLDTMCRGDDSAKLYNHPLTFRLSDTELTVRFYGTKECRHFTDWIGIAAFPANPRLCTITAIKEYLKRTKNSSRTTSTIVHQRKKIQVHPLILDLFDGKPILGERINKLTYQTLQACGIPKAFTGHSTRSATISKAIGLGAFEERVMNQARLHDKKTLKSNYRRLTTGIGPQVPDKTIPLSHILRYTYTRAN